MALLHRRFFAHFTDVFSAVESRPGPFSGKRRQAAPAHTPVRVICRAGGEPPHGGLSPAPAPSGHSRGVLIACRGKEDEAVRGRGDDAGLEAQVRRSGGAARRRPHLARRFGIGCGGRRGRRHLRRCEGFSEFTRSRADEPGRPRAGAGPAAPGVGRQPPAGSSATASRPPVRSTPVSRAPSGASTTTGNRSAAGSRSGARTTCGGADGCRSLPRRGHRRASRHDGSRPHRRQGGSGGGGCARSRVAPASACLRTMRFGRRNPERVFMQRQDLRASSRAVSVYPRVRDAQQRLRAR